MIVRNALDADVRAVFAHLAPERGAEMTATAFHDDPGQVADELLALRDYRPTVKLFALCPEHGFPLAIVGAVPLGLAYGAMIWAATPRWWAIALPSHRWWHRAFVPQVLRQQYRRVEFTALASDIASRRWLKTLGFTEEGTAYRQGKCGEDFIHFAWLNPDPTVGVVNA